MYISSLSDNKFMVFPTKYLVYMNVIVYPCIKCFLLKVCFSIQDFLLKMPGVNAKNYRLIMNRVESLSALCDCSLEQLTDILGSQPHARQLHDFLHTKPAESTDKPAKPAKSDFKRGFKRKR